MPRLITAPRRIAVPAGLATLALMLVGASSAQAAITSTSITSPSDPAYYFDPNATDSTGSVSVSGTTDSTAASSDAVDIDCYNDDGGSGSSQGTLASDVKLTAGGGFSTTVPYTAFESLNAYAVSGCRLRAVPTGTTPTTGLGGFAGPRVLVGYLSPATNSSGQVDDYWAFAPQLTASVQYGSLGDWGVADAQLTSPTVFGDVAEDTFYGNDTLGNGGNASVDGTNAFTPANTPQGANEPGFEPLKVSASQDASTGNVTIHETDPFLVCANISCTGYVASGVQDQRTITQDADGHRVLVEDQFSSTDGKAHRLTLNLQNSQNWGGTTDPGGQMQYQFPGQSGYSTYPSAATVRVPSTAPASIFVNAGAPDGAPSSGRGAITYGTAPSSPFDFVADGALLTAPYALQVPASGSATLYYAYPFDSKQASVDADAASAEASIASAEDAAQPPAVRIGSPADGSSVSSSSVTVSGMASAGSGVRSVTVDGVSASVSGSSFSASVPLSAGSNTVTATVTSNGGKTATASEQVTYVPATSGGPQPQPQPQPTPSKQAPKKQPVKAKKGKKAVKVRPRRLTVVVRPGRARQAPYRYRVSGQLVHPARVAAKKGCTGNVTVRVMHGTKVVASRRVRLSRSCAYAATARVPAARVGRHGTLKVAVSFGGNAALKAVSAKPHRVTYG